MIYSDNWLGMIFYDSRLDDLAEQPSEEISEQASEETSEQASEDTSEQPSEEISEQASEETSEQPSEEISEQASEESTAFSLVFADPSVDTHLYMSSEVEGATLNDVFSMQLSIRNILLVFLCVFVIFKFGAIIRRAVLNLIS